MNRPMIASCEYRADTACSEYGSHGRSMPKPSIPGIGKRFSSRLTTNMNPRKESAAKKPTFEGEYQGTHSCADRSGERDQRIPRAAAKGGVVDIYRTARQRDPAKEQEDDRKDDAHQQVGVAEWIKGQVAIRLDCAVAAEVRHHRVTELVDAKRGHPA